METEPKDKMSYVIFFLTSLTLTLKNDVGLWFVCFGGCLNNHKNWKKPSNHFQKEKKTVLVTDNSMPRAGDYSKAQAIFQSNYGLRRDWCSGQWSKIISLTSPTKKEWQEIKSSAQSNDTPIEHCGPCDTHTSDCAGISFNTNYHKTPCCLAELELLWSKICDAP